MRSPPGTLTHKHKKTLQATNQQSLKACQPILQEGSWDRSNNSAPGPALSHSLDTLICAGLFIHWKNENWQQSAGLASSESSRACGPSGLMLDLPRGVVPVPSFFACYYTRMTGMEGMCPKKAVGCWRARLKSGSGHWLLCSVMARPARLSARPDHPPQQDTIYNLSNADWVTCF